MDSPGIWISPGIPYRLRLIRPCPPHPIIRIHYGNYRLNVEKKKMMTPRDLDGPKKETVGRNKREEPRTTLVYSGAMRNPDLLEYEFGSARSVIQSLDLKKLQEEKLEIQTKIEEKEKEYEKHTESVTDMIDSQAKAMTDYLRVISEEEDEKSNNMKEMAKLDQEIQDLECKINKIKQEQRARSAKNQQCSAQIEKMESKKKKLEMFMESELIRMKQEGETINREIEKLNDSLQANIKATEDLERIDITTKSDPLKTESKARMFDFLTKSINEKEKELECPVCLETADVPIYTCPEMHLICSSCWPKVKVCPECREEYSDPPRRHRYAERTVEELNRLRLEVSQLSGQ